MSGLICLKCKTPLDAAADACPACGDRVTHFQRTYSTKLLDGKYQILERLGLGGMGEIFKVRHIHLGEQRVVKIMRSNIASDEQALQRFLHEARLATMIKHRNLAMLYDFSTLEDGSYYMVWEYIEGTNIQKWIASNGPMPGRLGLEVAIQALSGLEALHQIGIIHRDISPENIMLSQDHMGRLLVKVIDFGIAKQLDESGASSGHGLTQTGMFLGKLKYASPEQAGFLKEGDHLDARSDLYSFGVVFYEMLAGRAPFIASNPNAYLLKHATEKPAPIVQVAPGVEVNPKLEAVVFRSLEKDRDVRQATAAEFIHELETLRSEVEPDKKYGLGDRLTTVSGRTTAVHPTRPTAPGTTSPATAAAGRPAATLTPAPTLTPSPIPTRAAGDEATIVERAPVTVAASEEATMVDRSLMGNVAAPTVAERLAGGAAATVIEPRAPFRSAPTLAEAPAASKKPLWIALAAVLVVALAIGGYLVFAPAKPGPVITDTTVTAQTPSTDVTTTSIPTIAPGNGLVELRGVGRELVKIEDVSNSKEIDLATLKLDDTTTPLLVPLPPGEYQFVVRDSNGQNHNHVVTLSANQVQPIEWRREDLDLDKLAGEILQK